MTKEEQIKMPYINDLSVNHYLGRRRDGGYYVKPEVKNWKEELSPDFYNRICIDQ